LKRQEGGYSLIALFGSRVAIVLIVLILLASCKETSTPEPAPAPDAPPSTLMQQSDELAVISVDPTGAHRYPQGI
jgi:hypothetical protein